MANKVKLGNQNVGHLFIWLDIETKFFYIIISTCDFFYSFIPFFKKNIYCGLIVDEALC